MDIKINIDDRAIKVLDSWLGVGKFQEWIQHAANNKIRKRLDASVEELDPKIRAKGMTEKEKFAFISDKTLVTREKRDEQRR